MSNRIHNILYNIYTEYYEIKRCIYYTNVKMIYYCNKALVYNLQQQMMSEYIEKMGKMDFDGILIVIQFDYEEGIWYKCIPPSFYSNGKYIRIKGGGLRCFKSWREYINKYFILINPTKVFDPYMRFESKKASKWDIFIKKEVKELVYFTKTKKRYNYNLIVLYVKRLIKSKDINYIILSYLFQRKNMNIVYRIFETTKKANLKYVEGIYK